ncbi:MAG: hypothetical protein ACLRWQ_15315 [Flavonifractor plautii]
MVDWAQLYLFELIFMRMSGFLLFNPLLGRTNLPAMVKDRYGAGALHVCVCGRPGQPMPHRRIPWWSWRFAFGVELIVEFGLVLGIRNAAGVFRCPDRRRDHRHTDGY